MRWTSSRMVPSDWYWDFRSALQRDSGSDEACDWNRICAGSAQPLRESIAQSPGPNFCRSELSSARWFAFRMTMAWRSDLGFVVVDLARDPPNVRDFWRNPLQRIPAQSFAELPELAGSRYGLRSFQTQLISRPVSICSTLSAREPSSMQLRRISSPLTVARE